MHANHASLMGCRLEAPDLLRLLRRRSHQERVSLANKLCAPLENPICGPETNQFHTRASPSASRRPSGSPLFAALALPAGRAPASSVACARNSRPGPAGWELVQERANTHTSGGHNLFAHSSGKFGADVSQTLASIPTRTPYPASPRALRASKRASERAS